MTRTTTSFLNSWRSLLLGIAIVLAAALTGTGASAEDSAIGQVKIADGDCALMRGDTKLTAAPGIDVYKGDRIVTGGQGRLGITFNDETIISIGPDTEVIVDEYLYAPAEGKLGFTARLTQGTLQFISGVISKLSPQTVALKTPSGTIGVRGTRFLVKVTP